MQDEVVILRKEERHQVWIILEGDQVIILNVISWISMGYLMSTLFKESNYSITSNNTWAIYNV